jgi:hypothetical protein
MTEKQTDRDEADQANLDPETVADLEVEEEDADAVRGGPGTSGNATCRQQ